MADKNEQIRHPRVFRFLHDVIMWAIAILIVTGFYIHYPFFSNGGGILMSLMRGTHFFAAGLLIISGIIRIIMMFVGKNRDVSSFVWGFSDIAKLPKQLAYYLHITKAPRTTKKYNPLQMAAYLLAFVLVVFQIFSGLALMFPGAFGWFNNGIFGTIIHSRLWHYIVTWVFVFFGLIHIYLNLREGFHEVKEMHLLTSKEEN